MLKLVNICLITEISRNDMEALKTRFPENPFIILMIVSALRTHLGFTCAPVLRELFRMLYKDIAPANAIAPYQVNHVITQIASSAQITSINIDDAFEFAPVLAKLLLYASQHTGTNKYDVVVLCVRRIESKLKACYTTSNRLYQRLERDVSTAFDYELNEAFRDLDCTGVFFPGRPVIRTVGNLKTQKEKECNKESKTPNKLGAGTLLFWCGEHRFCIGFMVLTDAESVKQCYELLVSRFSVMPRTIIYDNGCNLSEYIYNRTPYLFKNTLIVSDGFHWKNHINCCDAFNSKIYAHLKGYT
jgi:hypothetical protein